jgi:hypothetical protein
MEPIFPVEALLAFLVRKIKGTNYLISLHANGAYPRLQAEYATTAQLLREVAAEGLDNGNALGDKLCREQSAQLSLLASIRPNVGRKQAKKLLLEVKAAAQRVELLELLAADFSQFADGWKSNAA